MLFHRREVCDALALVEAAVRDRLADISYAQCQLDLRELHKERDAAMKRTRSTSSEQVSPAEPLILPPFPKAVRRTAKEP